MAPEVVQLSEGSQALTLIPVRLVSRPLATSTLTAVIENVKVIIGRSTMENKWLMNGVSEVKTLLC
jgi:hypothetical protein